MNEFQLIEKINKILDSEFGLNEIGPGDDSALIAGIDKDQLLLSKDLLIEGVHFDFQFSNPQDVGWKSLAVNHSDICAMGGEIVGYLIGIGVPATGVETVAEIYRGMKEYLDFYGGKVYGGDVVKSQKFLISVTAIGKTLDPIKRSGAQKGDSIWVSGEIGLAQIGLEILKDPTSYPNLSEASKNIAIQKHRRPCPQVELANFLVKNKIPSSMIDISDGLYQDLFHLAKSSKKSFCLKLEDIPLNVDGLTRKESIRLFSGGEDFQLAFTVPGYVDTSLLAKNFPNCVKIGVVVEELEAAIVVEENLKQVSLPDLLNSYDLESLELGYKHF